MINYIFTTETQAKKKPFKFTYCNQESIKCNWPIINYCYPNTPIMPIALGLSLWSTAHYDWQVQLTFSSAHFNKILTKYVLFGTQEIFICPKVNEFVVVNVFQIIVKKIISSVYRGAFADTNHPRNHKSGHISKTFFKNFKQDNSNNFQNIYMLLCIQHKDDFF